ncbi:MULTISPECIES: hypothetical protein [Asticcacaulis]|uniref:hypothetical protein n=1 Tax=Asticcacaulis TaxID=76890 RepID=UPI001AE1653E|nr:MULTISPECIES: hypothetical protein [Asticcacaulis]MBP2161246.1 membrane protein YdbS with pleckstrin-like domain [Asticcacaulis solisilvae]MDR6802388.1 membrane protein YdbS with pleckstrin-like domain [Asticcacaulis sp. BE141]
MTANTNTASMTMADRAWQTLRILGWLGVAAILIAPAVAMQFTSEVQWTQSDFIFAGIVLIGGGAIVELFALGVRNPLWRIGFGVCVVTVAAVIWGMSI